MYSDHDTHLKDDLIHEYLDGELNVDMNELVQRHLKVCSECADRLHRWRSLFSEIEQLPDLDPAMNLAPAVLVRLTAPKPPRSRTFWLMAGQTALALVLLTYGWLQLSIQLPTSLVNRYLLLPLQMLISLIDNLSLGLEAGYRQFLVWSFSSSDLFVLAPQIQAGGSLLIYLVILLIVLWIASNRFLLGLNRHREDTCP